MNRLITISAISITAVFLIGTVLITQRSGGGDQFVQCRSSTVAGGDLGGSFELLDKDGQTVTDKDVITEPTLIYFGYTYCPDVCPLDVDRNANAVDILQERNQRVTPVFISIDPQRDTPEVVGDFASNMHPRMIGLTGSPEQVKAASTAYRTYYNAHPAVDDEYLVDHSTFSYLVLPKVGFVEYFRRDITPEVLADKIGCFVENM